MTHDLTANWLDRRSFVGAAAGLALAGLPRRVLGAAPPMLVTSIRSLSNPYHAIWKEGADAFAKQIGFPNVTLVTEGNSEKGISDIRAMIAKTGSNMVLSVDPNNTPDARPIVEACAGAKVYVVSWWNKPCDLHPWDFNPYYITHIEFDGVGNGAYIT
jgi:ribose transport system substrate-binding protein